jgi:hypothetical protein
MRPPQERLNDRLEQIQLYGKQYRRLPGGFTSFAREDEQDPELESLVAVAQRLRTLPQIQVAPDFAAQLERRVLRRAAELRLQRSARKRGFLPALRLRPALAGTLGFCLLFLVLSTGLLAFASQVSNPANPLYALRRLEQHVQVSLAGDQAAQATLDLQFARDSLNTLASLADSAHAAAYGQALADLDQHLQDAASSIDALPAGTQRAQLTGELKNLQLDAIHILRGLLPRLTLSERLATTAQLARLGDTIPQVFSGIVTLPPHPNGHATVALSGSNLQPGAQLLVDGKLTGVTGAFQNGLLVFALTNWNGARHPHSLGVLNPDGTAAQTTAITIHMDNGNSNGSSNSTNKNGNGNGNGGNSNGNKPTVTPTPHH